MLSNEPQRLMTVKITSDFWNRYRDLVVKEVLPYQWDVMNDSTEITMAEDPQKNGLDKKSHAVANLKIAAHQIAGHHYGFPFQDTDVYKWLEAAAYSLKYDDDPDLKKITEGLIDLIADAQDEDGYLSTYFQIDDPNRKFKRLQQSHELYTMGHYIEAAVAYYKTTASKKALNIALKMADCIDRHFGSEVNKIHGYDGHPEIELALVRLFEVTKEVKYLNLATYFINERGIDSAFFEDQNKADGLDNDLIAGMQDMPKSYYQAAEPINEQQTADGHAVRVVYLCTGMAYVAKNTGDTALLESCHRFWNDIVKRRMYVTGNIGSTKIGESFTYDYDLPSDTMYGETCASVGMAFFAQQMLNIEAKCEYADVLEKELFNGTISGMALDGKHFFYVNPLEVDPIASQLDPSKRHVLTQRADWFGCACCPANLARLITSVDQYIYTEAENTILSHQFIANDAQFKNGVYISQTNNFPWDGIINFSINNSGDTFKFGIRIPNWTQKTFHYSVNGIVQNSEMRDGFIYFEIPVGKTEIELVLDMTVKFLSANSRVRELHGKVAVQRGPIIYAAEATDNEGALWNYDINTDIPAMAEKDDSLLNGVVTLAVAAQREDLAPVDSDLYQESQDQSTVKEAQLVMVPYYTWANRDVGQ